MQGLRCNPTSTIILDIAINNVINEHKTCLRGYTSLFLSKDDRNFCRLKERQREGDEDSQMTWRSWTLLYWPLSYFILNRTTLCNNQGITSLPLLLPGQRPLRISPSRHLAASLHDTPYLFWLQDWDWPLQDSHYLLLTVCIKFHNTYVFRLSRTLHASAFLHRFTL